MKMFGISGRECHWNWFIFIAYIVFCVNHSILVTWTQDRDKGYGYNATAAILHTDALKLLVALFAALYSKPFSEIIGEVTRNIKVCALYFVPSFLYVVYNNLAFVNLQYFDPTSYYILMQLRVVISGVVYQVLFNRTLSRKQWISLVLLTCGCMLQQASVNNVPNPQAEESDEELDIQQAGSASRAANYLLLYFNPGIILLLLQITSSTVAGVYTELLVKRHSAELDFWIQNVFMYLNSLLCGLLIFALSGQPYQQLFCLQDDDVSYTQRLKIIAVILNMAAMGLVTAVFLKYLNSIIKNFATALEVFLTAFASWVMFSTPISLLSIIAMAGIVLSIYIYSTNPLQTLPLHNVGVRCERKVHSSESEGNPM